MQAAILEGGFVEAPIDSARAFRQIMTAMAQPGTINEVTGALPPAPLSIAAGVVLLTMCDPETPVFLTPKFDTDEVRAWITFHTGAPFTAANNAAFAVGAWGDLPLNEFSIGSSEYPDRSATLIVETDHLSVTGATLRGPGIKDTATLSLPDAQAFQNNALLFPLGLDFIFTCQSDLAALPRTTKVS
ncbi:phosphonate C-P lyase system protein PhnH [Loktanella sp. D2R18]|uniref:phosphonate C-P lyase system protein PhnH n=1 Tax=Rhodobacterales TaxID=204455 RepID=UPI000DE8ED80|nr:MULTISPECIES: phosphonate C-P lyase system protein PhnH [Rhodobacterales]MDO6591067.1 phosphonate C-P lyase system protein PhnH [Yoonia sp. 1_MG-2023]RBW42181.1 phosphonate C-P lyase system protein PhnH [Loktanella sp. D2R18]